MVSGQARNPKVAGSNPGGGGGSGWRWNAPRKNSKFKKSLAVGWRVLDGATLAKLRHTRRPTRARGRFGAFWEPTGVGALRLGPQGDSSRAAGRSLGFCHCFGPRTGFRAPGTTLTRALHARDTIGPSAHASSPPRAEAAALEF